MIRPYSSADHDAVVQIFKSNCPPYFAPEEEQYLHLWMAGKDEGRIAYSNADKEYFFVLEEKGEIIGCGGYYLAKGKNAANLVWGMVHSDHHKRGHGTQLYRYRIEHITQHHPDYNVTMDTSQHTFGFYEKMGLKVSSITNDGYGEGLHRYDML